MNNWVVLFVRTGFEHKLKEQLQQKLNPDEFLPFLPLKVYIYRRNMVIKEKEKIALETLIDSKDCLRGSKAVKEGDKTQIISGPLTGLESIIKKTNSHNREVNIEIEMMSAKREVKVYLEMINNLAKPSHP